MKRQKLGNKEKKRKGRAPIKVGSEGNYRREILVCVLGLTPQILTETLYCLMTAEQPVEINEIHAITTLKGYKSAVKSLLDGDTGMFYKFCEEYGIPAGMIKFGSNQIHVIRDRNGNKLVDIRNSRDNEDAEKFIFNFIRDLTSDPNCRLHCSVAGGRKTLSVILAFAIQLLGRKQDKLYHVLTKEDVEGHPEFFFKPRRSHIIVTQSGKRLDARKVHIDLAEIPFVRLRDLTEVVPGFDRTNFRRIVGQVQKAMELVVRPAGVRISRKPFAITIGEQLANLTAAQGRIYAYFLLQKFNCRKRTDCSNCYLCYPKISKLNIDEFWQTLRDELTRFNIGIDQISPRISIDQFRSQISKINRAMGVQFGNDPFWSQYTITSIGKRLDKSYGIPIDKKLISIS